MSNQTFFSAQPVCPSSAAEGSNTDDGTNRVTFQDALENPIIPGDSSQGEMNSNTEI